MKSKWNFILLPFICFSISVQSSVTSVLSCLGGQVTLEGNINSLVQCIQNDNPPLAPLNNSSAEGATYIYVLTNNSATIITSFEEGGNIDLDSYGVGTYRIYGFSYTGVLNQNTLQAGMPYMGISSNDCFSYSTNYITITRNSCEAVNCQGGNIFTNEGDTYISVCADGLPDIFSFTTTATGNANYTFILSDASGNIAEISSDNSFDFDGLAVGQYKVSGLSYHGQFLSNTAEPGNPLNQLETDGFCMQFSVYDILVDVVECELGEGCTHLYFSEYIEGTNNNRALEIYNPTPFPVNLNDYDIFVYTNGATTELPVMALSGILLPGDVYVVTHSQAAQELLSVSDITGGVATFSGNDAIALLYNLQPIDVIGVIGEDPGINGWSWQNGLDISSTTNRTFVRKPSVNAPTTSWTLSRGQWHVYPSDDFSHIGSHSAIACVGVAYLGFENSAVMVPESIGSFDVVVNGYNITSPIEAIVSVIAGNATPDQDYVNTFPVTLNFSSTTSTQSFSIEIIDDEIMEDYEYFTIQLNTTSGDISFVNQTLTINIEHSDQYYPDRTIASVITNNSFGIADSIDVFCTLGGVVHGLNLNAAGTEFTLIENHAGIKVFDPEDNFGYTVTEGDSVRVRGRVAQHYGMTYFYADSIQYINGGHQLNTPTVVTQLTEEHESAMVKIECVKLVNPLQWINLTSGFDVDVTDGTYTFVMHIDLDTDIYGLDPLDGHFTIIGIGAQHDEVAPYHSGYSVWPRYIQDITGRVIASFTHTGELIFGDGGGTGVFENTSTGASTYLWSFGDGETSTEENPTHSYPFSFFVGIADAEITLTVTDGQGCSDTYSERIDVVYSSIDEVTGAKFKAFPNPTNDLLQIQGEENISMLRVFDNLGKLISIANNINKKNLQIETSSWSSGIYFLEVESGNSISWQKVIKQ